MNPKPVTTRINETALAILEKHPEGVRWADHNRMIEKSDRTFHPKTVNGCVWKVCERLPDKVCKPEPGLFKLKKHR